MPKHITALLIFCVSASAMAAGPLVLEGVSGHVPARYEDPNIVFDLETGPLNTQLDNDAADQLVRDALDIWNVINTSSINLTASENIPTDIDATNFTSFIPDPYDSSVHNDDDGLNPVVYDTDGSIIDAYFGIGQGTGANASVVGFSASSIFIGASYFTEGFAVVNGNENLRISNNQLTLIIAHEIGHYMGLDHTQVNISNTESLFDACPAAANEYPLMYPYACRTSEITHPDDNISLSILYPISNLNQSLGQLTGTFKTADGTPVNGANIWVQNTSTGDIYSIVSDYLKQCRGFFALLLPPGNYTVHANSINDEFYAGSSVGPWAANEIDSSFQPPASTLGLVDFNAGGTPPAIINLAAGKAADIDFRADGSGSITLSDSQIDLAQIYNAAGSCSPTDTTSDGGGGSPSLPLLTAVLCLSLLRRMRQD
ncbi:MAG: carboxypeptidase-like regulatory domain-containing protein [Gammaproteobacteria bacterium]